MPSVPPPALVCPAGPSRPLVNAVGGEEGETLSQDPETAKEELASDRFRERSCARDDVAGGESVAEGGPARP